VTRVWNPNILPPLRGLGVILLITHEKHRSSLAMCSSPQVGFSAAIFRINSWRFLGSAGLPTGLDFQRQNKRNPL
jgi:hypothetical protein